MLNKFRNVKDYRWLRRYLRFIETFKKNRVYKNHTHNHHILPKANYEEYSNLKENQWNLAILGYREHYLAHYMLAKALGGNMWYAWHRMRITSKDIKMNSSIFEDACKNHSAILQLKKGMPTGYKHTTESINKIRMARLNQKDPRIGCTHSEKSKQKISNNRKGKMTGKNHFKVDTCVLFDKFGRVIYTINESLTSFNKKVDEPILKINKQKGKYKTRFNKYKKYEGYYIIKIKNISFSS